MSKQTENYIILKPIAERFNEVAKSISDDEIKYIIKEAMKEQIHSIFDFSKLNEITEEYIENNEEDIKYLIANSIRNKLK